MQKIQVDNQTQVEIQFIYLSNVSTDDVYSSVSQYHNARNIKKKVPPEERQQLQIYLHFFKIKDVKINVL